MHRNTRIENIQQFTNLVLFVLFRNDYRTTQRPIVADTHCMLGTEIHKRFEVSISSQSISKVCLYKASVYSVISRIYPIERRHNTVRGSRCFDYTVRSFAQGAFRIDNQTRRYSLVIYNRLASKRSSLEGNLIHNPKFARNRKHLFFCESAFVSLAADRQTIFQIMFQPRPLESGKAQTRHTLPKMTS